jgi:hypothetical protein
MRNPFMVFQAPGPQKIHGHMVTFQIVDESEVQDRLAAGWFSTAIEAGEAYQAAQRAEQEQAEAAADDAAAVTREEAVQKLEQMGVQFDRRLGTKKLLALIEEKLA